MMLINARLLHRPHHRLLLLQRLRLLLRLLLPLLLAVAVVGKANRRQRGKEKDAADVTAVCLH